MKKKSMRMFLLFGVLIGTLASTAMAWAQAAPRTIDITVKRFSYDPGEITLKKGQPVVLVLKSEDVAHGLRIRDFDINLKVKAGGTAEARFTPEKAGDFIGRCSVFCGSGHGGLMLKLHVVD
jgi:cytochrome c oxidase subunit 2